MEKVVLIWHYGSQNTHVPISLNPMQFQKISRSTRRYIAQTAFFTVFLAIGVSGVATPNAVAQNGVTIFSGVERNQELSYSTDFGAHPGQTDRYYLKLNKIKMKQAVAKFILVFPDNFDGKVDSKKVEITVGGKNVEIAEVNWDKDNGRLEIYPKEAVPAKKDVKLVLSNVTNPSGGMYYVNCLIQVPGDVPIFRELGTWIMSFDR
jgi:hypothetical protein